MITIIKLQELFGDLSPRGMDQVFVDWNMLVGFNAEAECGRIAVAADSKEADWHLDSQHVIVETQIQKGEESFGKIFYGFPNDLVIEVLGEVLMIHEEAKKEKTRSGLSPNDIETFQEMANLLCGSWNRVFQDLESSLRISQSVDDLIVSHSVGSKSALVRRVPDGRVAWLEAKVTTDLKTHQVVIVLPFDVALAVTAEFYGTTDPRSARTG